MAIFGHIVSRILPSPIDLPTHLPTYLPTYLGTYLPIPTPSYGENYIREDCISRVVPLLSISGLSSFSG